MTTSISALAASPAPHPDDTVKKRAQTHFQRGELLFEHGEYIKAAEAFTLAYETLPHPAVLANIALAYERAGAFHLTVEYCRQYLVAVKETGEKNPKINTLLKETLPKVTELNISANCPSSTCRIHVDGVDRGPQSVLAVVLPGEHDVKMVDGGKTIQTIKVRAAPGEALSITLENNAERASITDADAMTPKQKGTPRFGTPFWISAGVAIGAGIASGALWGATLTTKNEFDKSETLTELQRLKTEGERRNLAALVVTGIAGAAAVAAVIFATTGASSSRNESPDPGWISVGPEGLTVTF